MFEGVKLATGPKVAFCEWDEEGKLRFLFRALTCKESLSLTVGKNGMRHKKKGDYDSEGFARNRAKKCIIGWDGLTEGHLLRICEVKSVENPDKEIPYSEEAKEYIVDHMSLDFAAFIGEGIEFAEEHGKEQEKN